MLVSFAATAIFCLLILCMCYMLGCTAFFMIFRKRGKLDPMLDEESGNNFQGYRLQSSAPRPVVPVTNAPLTARHSTPPKKKKNRETAKASTQTSLLQEGENVAALERTLADVRDENSNTGSYAPPAVNVPLVAPVVTEQEASQEAEATESAAQPTVDGPISPAATEKETSQQETEATGSDALPIVDGPMDVPTEANHEAEAAGEPVDLLVNTADVGVPVDLVARNADAESEVASHLTEEVIEHNVAKSEEVVNSNVGPTTEGLAATGVTDDEEADTAVGVVHNPHEDSSTIPYVGEVTVDDEHHEIPDTEEEPAEKDPQTSALEEALDAYYVHHGTNETPEKPARPAEIHVPEPKKKSKERKPAANISSHDAESVSSVFTDGIDDDLVPFTF